MCARKNTFIFAPSVGDVRVQFYWAGHSGDTVSALMYGGFQGGPQLGPPDAERRQSLGQQMLDVWRVIYIYIYIYI